MTKEEAGECNIGHIHNTHNTEQTDTNTKCTTGPHYLAPGGSGGWIINFWFFKNISVSQKSKEFEFFVCKEVRS
jgi:hypothetical protein